jgi:hypothetical protein
MRGGWRPLDFGLPSFRTKITPHRVLKSSVDNRFRSP